MSDKKNAAEKDQELLEAREAEILKDYKHVVKGTIRRETSGRWTGKITVEIECQHKDKETGKICGERRRVATSDLHQVSLCEEHTRERRQATRRKKAKKARAEKAAAKGEKVTKAKAPKKAAEKVTEKTEKAPKEGRRRRSIRPVVETGDAVPAVTEETPAGETVAAE